ncbi:streptomycin 3''-kinase [Niabella soli DSM 19437]|uniref:Streptomycin 3''-kinase n=1 Tax=Niabella soli DSM 19437 TaxID=929713 RepID=W0EZL9_9BACT|nr:streptomycin 3''-kinase [Niabella soli DSM 19437]
MLTHYMRQWQLKANGAYFFSYASLLQPAWYSGQKALLKISLEEEEQLGGLLMQWWKGNGAARVLQYSGEALLLEWVDGGRSLKQMAENGQDNEATRIICQTANLLHAKRTEPLPQLIDLNDWFYTLFHSREKYGDQFAASMQIARQLLQSATAKKVLHGDLHHENILYSEERGWLAIDPKRLYGEAGFDYANLFCNPTKAVALAPGRLEQQLKIVCSEAPITQQRMLQWIVAWTALSGLWLLDVGEDAFVTLTVNQIALTLLSP